MLICEAKICEHLSDNAFVLLDFYFVIEFCVYDDGKMVMASSRNDTSHRGYWILELSGYWI